MSPDERDDEEREAEHYDVDPPRSVFSALWFRVVLVVIVIGVVAAVAVPYVLEWMNPPPPRTTDLKPGMPTVRPPSPPVAPPAPAPQPPPAAKREPAPAPPAPAMPAIAAKPPEPTLEEKPKAAAPAPAPKKAVARKPAKAVAKAPAAAGGAYFVQVGAFKDPEHARKLVAKLRGDKFRVSESMTGARDEKPAAPAPAASGADKYDVFVSGGAVAEINAKLAAKGLATETAANGVVVKPSLPLREAVALSKDLAVDGLKVQVRRAAGASPAPPPPAAPAPAASGDGLHRVMVGPFADRAEAAEALQALRGKGYKDSFIARGG